jgi:hypothetical protein
MRLLFPLSLLLCAVVAVRQSPPKQSPTNRSEQHKQANNKDVPSIPAPSAAPSEINIQVKAPSPEQKTSNWHEWFWPPEWANWALVIVATWTAIVALDTLREIRNEVVIARDELKHTEKFADAASKSAEAAALSAQSVINAERAWLIVTADMVSNMQKVKGSSYRFGFGFNWRVKNGGKTTAFITKIGARFHTVKDISELPDEPNIDLPALVEPTDYFPEGFGVGPNDSVERFTFAQEQRPVSQEDYEAASAGRVLWIAYGIVEYRLIFERDKIRETRFCYIWKPTGGEESFNRSPVPPNYTKQT